jgi:hypothetical protein
MVSAVALCASEVEQSRAPWVDNPYGVVTLLDMMRFYAGLFVRAFAEFHSIQCKWKSNDGVVPDPHVVAAHLSSIELDCASLGLKGTRARCVRLMEKYHKQSVTFRTVVSDLATLTETLEDELDAEVFIHLTPQEGALYDKPTRDWSSVVSRFSKVQHDIEECSKCFALGRYAAAVFHAMLIAEYGIIQVAELFGAAGDKPGWGALDRLQRINDKKWTDKTPLEQQHAKFLQSLLPLAFAMKNSWRHKMDHVANKIEWLDTTFDPEFANDIISATSGFMRRLATDLPK